MTDRPRFSLQLTFRDNLTGETLHMAMDLSHETIRISPRAVEEMRAGFGDFDETVRMMKVRSFRKDLFTDASRTLGALLAERMEDAEGWHGERRIEPARQQLGGRWR